MKKLILIIDDDMGMRMLLSKFLQRQGFETLVAEDGLEGVEIAKKMLADHYDVYLEREAPSFRTICGHWEVDNGMVPGTSGAYLPGGAIDGKVVDTRMLREWQMWVRWGHPCGTPFHAEEFLKKHPQYEWRRPYLKDIPANPWIVLPEK